MMKRCLQGFLLLLFVMSMSAAADGSPIIENETGGLIGCGILSMVDCNRIYADKSMHWYEIADSPAEHRNKEESMNSRSTQSVEISERIAMKKLDFLIGNWEGEGWLMVGPDQRYPFSVTESYSYRCGGLVVDGEGQFRPQGIPEGTETNVMYGLGMIYFDLQSGEYRMWHYGGTASGFVFTQKVEIDVEHRALHYINVDIRGETYKFGFVIDDEGILTARTERQKPDGTWHVSMEFRMRKIQLTKEKEW